MRVGNVKEIVFSKDPKQMNWLREDFPYAEVKCPPEYALPISIMLSSGSLVVKRCKNSPGARRAMESQLS